MRIPDTFISQGIWWRVRYSDDIEDLGQTDYDTQEIILRKSMSPELKAATFFHELHHTFNTTIDHSVMDSIAMQYFQILIDNHLWTK